jgi:hypothetical protein
MAQGSCLPHRRRSGIAWRRQFATPEQQEMVVVDSADATCKIARGWREVGPRPGSETQPARLLPIHGVGHADDPGRTLGHSGKNTDDPGDRDAVLTRDDLDHRRPGLALLQAVEAAEDVSGRVLDVQVVSECVQRDVDVEWPAVDEAPRQVADQALCTCEAMAGPYRFEIRAIKQETPGVLSTHRSTSVS